MTIAYKVLREDLTSLQLLSAPHMQYISGAWNKPSDGTNDHPRKGGGLWVAPTLGAAKALARYMKNKHGVKTRIFKCEIGEVLHRTSCRIKTDKLRFSLRDEFRS